MAHPQPELLTGFVVLPDGAAGGPGDLHRPSDDGPEHRLKIERRAQGTADLPKRRQLVNRARQIGGPCLELAQQPRVLDGDYGLICEGLQEFDVPLREGVATWMRHTERAHDIAPPEHRNGKPTPRPTRSAS